jgi:hypothetical protein
MTHILLTGAGFSYNWGGPLAAEVFNGLLSDNDIDGPTRELLFAAHGAGGFERVLAQLQLSAAPEDRKRYNALITAVVGLFNGLNNTFMQIQNFEFESMPEIPYSVHRFLTRFHAIFTLNQDALMELHYIPLVSGFKWGRANLPGVKYLNSYRSGTKHDCFALMEPNPADFAIGPGVQPYIKLHGSVNWVSAPDRVLIMGGEKTVSINRFPLLTWYHQEFRKMLQRPEARLMVIGYGFGDAHINDAILDGLKNGLRFYLVDPSGLRVLENDSRLPRFRNQLIGMSTKPLKDIFGGNRYEHSQLVKFLES